MPQAIQGTSAIWHLDAPQREPVTRMARVRGWIVAREAVRSVSSTTAPWVNFTAESRPDLDAAFPEYPHRFGFRAEIPSRCVGRELRLHVTLESGVFGTRQLLPPTRGSSLLRLQAFAQSCAAACLDGLAALASRDLHYRLRQEALMRRLRAFYGEDLHRDDLMTLLQTFAASFPDARFVHVGANDGVTGDPLFDHIGRTRWIGLLVEPLRGPFAKLQQRHGSNPRIKLARAAVSDTPGEVPIYRLRDGAGPKSDWYSQLSTFDRTVLESHRPFIPNLDDLIITEPVRTELLETLLKEAGLDRIDLFVTDTEGYDEKVLGQLDLARHSPRLILFEHQHLTPDARQRCVARLKEHGYKVCLTPEGDGFAWPRLLRGVRAPKVRVSGSNPAH